MNMKSVKYLFLIVIGLAACQNDNTVVVDSEYDTNPGYYDDAPCRAGENGCHAVRYSMPNGNDLVLETDRQVINITAQPGTKYKYYVWTGDKATAEVPDLVIENGRVVSKQ